MPNEVYMLPRDSNGRYLPRITVNLWKERIGAFLLGALFSAAVSLYNLYHYLHK